MVALEKCYRESPEAQGNRRHGKEKINIGQEDYMFEKEHGSITEVQKKVANDQGEMERPEI